MSVIDRTNVLSGIKVNEAMRRLVVSLPQSASVEQAARFTIKFKVNAILVLDGEGAPVGVVSKTDLMGAYYAGMDLDTPVEAIMVGPPLFCGEGESLEGALDRMKANGIHRLYVYGESSGDVVGVLAYPDIVGMLYRFCHKCERSLLRLRSGGERLGDHYRVAEIMSPSAHSVSVADSLAAVMETLSAHRFGAILVMDRLGIPGGVVSKSDLMLAYRHGLSTEVTAGEIMSRPVHACSQEASLASAIQHMIYSDVHRMFVYKDEEPNIVGTLSLSDAARARSGSCRACMSSRIRLEETAP